MAGTQEKWASLGEGIAGQRTATGVRVGQYGHWRDSEVGRLLARAYGGSWSRATAWSKAGFGETAAGRYAVWKRDRGAGSRDHQNKETIMAKGKKTGRRKSAKRATGRSPKRDRKGKCHSRRTGRFVRCR